MYTCILYSIIFFVIKALYRFSLQLWHKLLLIHSDFMLCVCVYFIFYDFLSPHKTVFTVQRFNRTISFESFHYKGPPLRKECNVIISHPMQICAKTPYSGHYVQKPQRNLITTYCSMYYVLRQNMKMEKIKERKSYLKV